jgi:hypothetical protein
MSALFDFQGMLTCLLLAICMCAFLKPQFPKIFHPRRPDFWGVLGKLAVIGERLSPYVSLACFIKAGITLVLR